MIDHPIIFVLLAFVSFSLVWNFIYYRWYYNWQAKKHGCQIPAKYLSFPFGIKSTISMAVSQVNNTIIDDVASHLKEHPTVLVEMTQPVIMTKEPDNVKALLSTKFTDFGLGDRKKWLQPIIGEGIFGAEGEHWKHSRAMLRPVFARERVSKLAMLEKHFQFFIPIIDSHKSPFDIQAKFLTFTLDTALEFLFGCDINSLSDPDGPLKTKDGFTTGRKLNEAFSYVSMFMGYRRILGKLGYHFETPKFKRAIALIHSWTDGIIDDVLSEKPEDIESKTSFIADLSHYTTDRTVIRDQALTAFVAGRTTVASLMAHLCLELSRQPQLWATLREAVLRDIGPNAQDITYESIKGCAYLNWTVNEGLRVHPLVPANIRKANKDTVLPKGAGPDGQSPLFVPKGYIVMFHTQAIQCEEKYWGPDSHDFKPERWANLRPAAWSYIPFNGGPRICIGQQFALTEGAYVLARLAQEYEQLIPGQRIIDGDYSFHLGASKRVTPSVDVMFVRPAANA